MRQQLINNCGNMPAPESAITADRLRVGPGGALPVLAMQLLQQRRRGTEQHQLPPISGGMADVRAIVVFPKTLREDSRDGDLSVNLKGVCVIKQLPMTSGFEVVRSLALTITIRQGGSPRRCNFE